jgi:hypothetical protein
VDGDDICRPASVAHPFPEPEREYWAVELTADKRLADRWQLLASYRYSRLRGNWEGFYGSELQVHGTNAGALFNWPDEPYWGSTYSVGLLPTDRTHILRINGSYQFRFGLTLGASWNVLSGTPLTTYDTSNATPGAILAEGRGESGRTDSQSVVDLHLGYPVKLSKTELRLFLDTFNLFNEDAITGVHMERTTQTGVPNPGFGQDSRTLLPRSIRLGAKLTF